MAARRADQWAAVKELLRVAQRAQLLADQKEEQKAVVKALHWAVLWDQTKAEQRADRKGERRAGWMETH